MKNVNVSGVYLGADHKPQGVIDHNQKELAAYLARARGPGESAAKIVLRPRPTGETARVVFKEYDVPLEADIDRAGKNADDRRQRLAQRHAVAARLAGARCLGRSRRQSLVHLERAQSQHLDRPHRRQDRRRQDVQGARAKRACRQHPRHDARSERHHLVQLQCRARRAVPARSEDREDRNLPAARRACRRPAAPPPSIGTARARFGCRRRTARCASIP